MKNKTLIVIGGGAAGFFAAINAAQGNNSLKVVLLEKSSKLLSKVRVSGGGRCNVTHACFDDKTLTKFYPRGEKQLLGAFDRFTTKNTIQWFKERGVELKVEDDGRMFPITDSSETIIDCLMQEAEKNQVIIKTNADVKGIIKTASGFEVLINESSMLCDYVLIATGGNAKEQAYDWIKALGHTIEKPVPSLFTFNLPNNPITKLMGVSVPKARIKITGTKLQAEGPLLITHWGLSGPAVLRLSAFGARILNERNYNYQIMISWLPGLSEDDLRMYIDDNRKFNAAKQLMNQRPEIPARLWEYFLQKLNIKPDKRWAELTSKEIHALVNTLLYDTYEASGKTTFKEEFVTCGGIKLSEIDFKTMQSKLVPGLFFAGEVIDIDGVTGGFNFQNAWTTGWIASQSLTNPLALIK